MLLNDKAQKSTCYEKLSLFQQSELECYIKGLIQGSLAYSSTFTVPDIVGGKFRCWKDTPLEYIYEYHFKRLGEKATRELGDRVNTITLKEYQKEKERISNEAIIEAGKDVGRIVKYIMDKDENRAYKIIGTEQRRYPINRYQLIYLLEE